MNMKTTSNWEIVCTVDDLVPESGIAVWTEDGPVAVFSHRCRPCLPSVTPIRSVVECPGTGHHRGHRGTCGGFAVVSSISAR